MRGREREYPFYIPLYLHLYSFELSCCFPSVSILHNLFAMYVLICGTLCFPLYADGLSDDKVVERINTVVKLKKKVLGGFGSPEALSQAMNRPMILIGG